MARGKPVYPKLQDRERVGVFLYQGIPGFADGYQALYYLERELHPEAPLCGQLVQECRSLRGAKSVAARLNAAGKAS